jgi:hypothetical protein
MLRMAPPAITAKPLRRDEVLNPHGEERGNAARLEPRGHGLQPTMKIYLAGPNVFLPDAIEIGRRKVELCRRLGAIATARLPPAHARAPS